MFATMASCFAFVSITFLDEFGSQYHFSSIPQRCLHILRQSFDDSKIALHFKNRGPSAQISRAHKAAFACKATTLQLTGF
jgi:hypothetical protein